MKEPIVVSFSGGRTSAYMSYLLKELYDPKDLLFVFANTGQEHEKTLEFVQKVDNEFNLGVVWVEAVVHAKKGMGTTHRVVNFETATRDITLFKQMAQKYGLPNPSWLHCTRELKEAPIHSYIKTALGTKKYQNYKTAIGIRADEIDRIPSDYENRNLYYPLAENRITKHDINRFWANQSFDLEIPGYLGNCVWCWKKSAAKIKKIAIENRDLFIPAVELEKYADFGSGNETRKMFRGNLTATDILNDVNKLVDPENYENSCAESCEPFQQEFKMEV